VKNSDAEGSPEAQWIQQWEVVFHGNSSNKSMKQCRCEYRIRSTRLLTQVTHPLLDRQIFEDRVKPSPFGALAAVLIRKKMHQLRPRPVALGAFLLHRNVTGNAVS
jgi:hypothetical protein